jgi:protein-S-isoprenylcysteine O-methyltransferase Ste14
MDDNANGDRDNPGGIAVIPPYIYLGTLLLGLLLDRKVPAPLLPRGMARSLGWPLLGGGIALAVWFSRTMRRAGTSYELDKPASRLVTDGPFRYSRNPAYVSFTMIYAGLSGLRNSLWPILLLPMVLAYIQHRVIGAEERYLERRFGEEYLRYRSRVRRWI